MPSPEDQNRDASDSPDSEEPPVLPVLTIFLNVMYVVIVFNASGDILGPAFIGSTVLLFINLTSIINSLARGYKFMAVILGVCTLVMIFFIVIIFNA